MNTKDKSFHKTWHQNINKYDAKHINKTNVYKTILKIVLVLLIIFTLLVIYRWGQKIPDLELLDIKTEQSLYKPDTLLKPKLLLKNKYNEPIIIEAFQAEKNADNSNIIILDKPKGHYKLSNKKNIYFNSTKGILNSNRGILELIENVKIKSSDGMNLITNDIIYNYKNNIVRGQDQVTLDGKWGILKGKGFSYNLESSIINLKGRPKLSLYNNKGLIE
jgi:LPS export ABC transporter protein LptC